MQNRFVDKLSGFATLGERDVSALLRATVQRRAVPAKQDLIREGDRPGAVFVILEGWACRYKVLPSGARQVVGFLMPGDSCDLHIGLLAEMDHSIQTVTAVSYATIGRREMDALLTAHPAVAKAIYIAQLVDEGTLREWITSIGRRTSVERVAHLLCELYVRARNIGLIPGDAAFVLPVSQLLLADSLGVTAVHLNRVLRTLRVKGALRLDRRSIMLSDIALLVRIAGFDETYLHRRLRKTA